MGGRMESGRRIMIGNDTGMRLILLLFSMTLVMIPVSGDSAGGFSPVNPAFSSQSADTISPGVSSSLCCGSGPLRESPLDLSYLTGKKITTEAENSSTNDAHAEVDLPVSFDLRTLSKVPAIRDQGQSGSCWDFASVKSLESSLLPDDIRDFSENNLKNHVSTYYPDGFDYADGGNDLMAAAYFIRWSGPVPEQSDPYNPYSFKSPDNLPVVAHVPDVPMIPGRSAFLDNDNIKNGLMQFGCLYTTLYYDNTYFNQTSAAYYNPEGTTVNHAVSIIGWDDGYSAKNFLKAPPGDGAFICANSWGEGWGKNGFFYVSYYDILFGTRISAVTGSSADIYNGNYGYDPLGWVSSFGFGKEEADAANVFHAEADEVIEAIGFYIPQVNTAVSAGIYLDPKNGPVNDDGPDAYETTSYPVPGYHTLVFDEPVPVKKGQSFSAAIKFLTPEYGFPIPVEYAVAGYSSKANASPGQSWVKAPDGAWSDLTKWDSTANACIRVYTKRTSSPKAGFFAEPVSGTPPLTVRFTDASTGSPKRWLWEFGDGGSSTEQNPAHTYTREGTFTVHLTVDNAGGESKVVKENYISTMAPEVITVPDDHSLIQDAVDAARAGSTIRVRYGYYPEKLTIDKSLSLIGECNYDEQKPIIDAQLSGTPVSISADGVSIDNFSITGAWTSTAIRPAIAVRGKYARIVNNWIFENYAGIRCENGGQATIDGNIIWNSTVEAIYTENSPDVSLFNNTVLLTKSAPAVSMINGNGGIIRGNIIAENSYAGFALDRMKAFRIYDNFFNNSVNTIIGSSVSGQWYTEKRSGLNIVRGPYIGGNYWAAPDGSGFSETHQDMDGDGFCDEAFAFDGQTDALPLAAPGSQTVVADFEALPKEGEAPLSVLFYDFSTGPVETWSWQFGDGENSSEKGPSHTYTLNGNYTVSLTVSGSGKTHTTTKPSFIRVNGNGPDFQLMLSPGWNFITAPMPLLNTRNTAAIFASVDSDGHSVLTYSGLSWTVVKKDDIITPLVGYWIYSKFPLTIPLYYEPVTGIPEREVQAGWNCIGAPGKNPVSAKTGMSSLDDLWMYLYGFNSALQRYEDVIIRGGSGQYSDDRTLKPGSGYWLFMERAGTLRGIYSE